MRDPGDECDKECCTTHDLTPELDLGLAVVGVESMVERFVQYQELARVNEGA